MNVRTWWRLCAVLVVATVTGSGSPSGLIEPADGPCGTLCNRWCNEYGQCWCVCPIVTAQ